jgi:hypothetical protein
MDEVRNISPRGWRTVAVIVLTTVLAGCASARPADIAVPPPIAANGCFPPNYIDSRGNCVSPDTVIG